MKSKLLTTIFLGLMAAALRLPAQQGDFYKAIFDNVKAKAEKGDAFAQCAIGEYYFFGKLLGVTNESGEIVEWTKDTTEAVKWYKKSVEQGCAEAQYGLGICYRDGAGVNKDQVEAFKWFSKSAENGFAMANVNLGCCYANGDGVVKDMIAAVNCWQKAAINGNAIAQFNLGLCRANGEGGLKNYVEADKWLNLASAQGYEPAKKHLDAIERNLTAEQIAEAQRLAAAFVPNKTQSSISGNSASLPNPSVAGTGFFITEDGYFISNYHVVKNATKVRLLTGAGLIDASIVKVDVANDLALLKMAGKCSPLPIVSSRTAKLGATVATVGFPDAGLQGFSPKLAKGEIGSLAGIQDDPRYFQISVPVQPGNSGGALVDMHGNVVGIVAAKLNANVALDATGALPENVNYAVKSSLLLSFLESVPDVDAKLKDPNTKDEAFEDVVKSAQDATVLVLVY